MTTYHVDVQLGDDSNAGTSAGAGNAWKNDPTWATATGNAASVVLADNDIIEHHSDGTEIFLQQAVGVTQGFRPAVHNVNGMIWRTAAGNPDEVKYNFLYTHTSTANWTDLGGNIWEFTSLETAQTEVTRLFIGDVGQPMAATEGAVDVTSPWWSEQNTPTNPAKLVVYCAGNPYTVWGPGQANFAYQPSNEWHEGCIYFEGQHQDGSIVTSWDNQFKDFVLVGGRQNIQIVGSHSTLTFENIVGRKASKHGMRFYCDRSIPQKYNTFQSCEVYFDTTKDEFPLWKGERGGDGFDFWGPSLGHVIDGCHVQDNGHTAYQMHPQTVNGPYEPDVQFGVFGCEVRNSTCDNKNSIYGRAIGASGSLANFPLQYCVYKNIVATNMQTRSQIGGYRCKYQGLNFSGTSGTRTHDTDIWPTRRRGEGISASTWSGIYGDNDVIECELSNSVFVGSNLAGIVFRNTLNATAMSANQIFNNVCVDNNLVEDPDRAGEQYLQIIDEEFTGQTPNVYYDNSVGLTGAQTTDLVKYGGVLRTVTEWNTDLNALPQTPTANNVNDITRLAGDGRPATGSTIKSYGVLPALPVANGFDDATNTDFTVGGLWAANNGATLARDGGTYATANTGNIYGTPSFLGAEITISYSGWMWDEEDLPHTLTSDCRLATWNGVGSNNAPYQEMYAISDTTPADTIIREFTRAVAQPAGALSNQIKFQYADAEVPCKVGLAFPRIAIEDTAAWPLDYRYDRVDVDGVTATAAYLGAHFTIDNPRCPNVVTDLMYQGDEPGSDETDVLQSNVVPYVQPRYTEATAEAKLLLYFYTKGTVTSQYHPTIAVGEVISQGVVEGTQNAVNTAVDLVLSLGPEPPSVGGPSRGLSRARSALNCSRQGQR